MKNTIAWLEPRVRPAKFRDRCLFMTQARRAARIWPHNIDHDNLHASRSSDNAILQSTPKLWVFVLEAQPLPEAPEFMEFGGAYVLCYQMPGLARDPVRHASDFLRGAGWLVTGVQEEPEQRERDEAPEAAHFDQALIDDEAYVFHQWRIEDAAGQTRH